MSGDSSLEKVGVAGTASPRVCDRLFWCDNDDCSEQRGDETRS